MQVLGDERMNFILIDGTWSNSQAMFKRLKVNQKYNWDLTSFYFLLHVHGAMTKHSCLRWETRKRKRGKKSSGATTSSLSCRLYIFLELSYTDISICVFTLKWKGS